MTAVSTSNPGVRRPAVAAVLAAAVLTAMVAACSSDRDLAPACPDTSVVSDASTITRFGPGPGRDLLNVDLQAEIADLVTACNDKKKRDGVPVAEVVLAPVIVASRGPANQNRTPTLRYFVSVVDANQQILQKQTFDLRLDFTENRTRLVIRDDDPPIKVYVPNRKGAGARGYQVLVGFQLTQEELTYNRDRGASGVAPGALTRQSRPIQ